MSHNHNNAISAALSLYFSALHECDEKKFRAIWHPQGLLFGLSDDGSVVSRDSEAFCQGVVSRSPSSEYSIHDTVLSIHMLGETCAGAKVMIALPPATSSLTPTFEPTLYTDWLTLLHDSTVGGWRIISKVYSSTPLAKSILDGGGLASPPITPSHFSEVASAIWDGYVGSGRAGDEAGMSKIFHPYAKLTFINDEGGLTHLNSTEFCKMVGTRWSSEKHKPWAHLSGDPRCSAQDKLLSIDFAGPNVAQVTLKIGYPPYLYHDVLLLLRVSMPIQGRDGWWIVAKSSVNSPFLKDEAKEPA